jgi:AbrB family looped-hinge helix DNA binding protein
MYKNGTITSKMQITIPIELARKMDIKKDDKVQLYEENGRIIVLLVKRSGATGSRLMRKSHTRFF